MVESKSQKKHISDSVLSVDLVNLTNSTNYTYLTRLTDLTTKEKVLVSILKESKNIKKIEEDTKIDLATISMIIKRDTDKLFEVDKIDKSIKFYKPSEKAVKQLSSILELKKNQEQEQELKRIEEIQKKQSIEDIIQRFEEFINKNIKAELMESIRKGTKYLYIKFDNLKKFDLDLAEKILDDENVEELIKLCEIAVTNITDKELKIRFYQFPNTENLNIADLRSKHINKFVRVVGCVNVVSDVRPQVTSAKFECPQCGNIVPVLQLDKIFKEPTKCGCGRKGKFRLISKEMVDAQGMVLEEIGEQLGSRTQPKKIKVILKKDLTDIENQPHFEDSTPIIVNGFLKESPIPSRSGGKLTKFDLVIEAHSIEFDNSLKEITLDNETIKKIKELGKTNDSINKIVNSFSYEWHGLKKESEILILSIVSGGGHKLPYKKFRDDSHIIFVGDPGLNKSTMMLKAQELIQGSRWVSGKGSTGAGLIGTVSKDNQFGGDIILQKGALSMANNNVVFGDELDKMGEDNTNALHEALEQQYVSIDKWNKHTRLKTDTTFIASANPIGGHFDNYTPVGKQIPFLSTLINRFDVVIILRDSVGKKDIEVADKILLRSMGKLNQKNLINLNLMKAYIHYCRSKFNPILNENAYNEIKKYYAQLKSASVTDPDSGIEKSIRITPRHVDALIRLSRARAKLRLSNEVNLDDAKKTIELFNYFIQDFGIDVSPFKK